MIWRHDDLESSSGCNALKRRDAANHLRHNTINRKMQSLCYQLSAISYLRDEEKQSRAFPVIQTHCLNKLNVNHPFWFHESVVVDLEIKKKKAV